MITTGAPYQAGKGEQGPGAPYNAAAKFYAPYSLATDVAHDIRISHIAIDRRHTTAEDSGTYFPLPAIQQAATRGLIGNVAARFHGAPTNRSHRTTLDIDGPELVARCRDDHVDAVLLVANCPVCHQTISLVARALETAGIPTVVLGCAKDIVEHVGVPRFLFSDFPLGNPCGRPRDPGSQALTLELALNLLAATKAPRTTVQSPLRWADDPAWKLDYCNIDRMPAADIARLRAENDVQKETARAVREESGPGL